MDKLRICKISVSTATAKDFPVSIAYERDTSNGDTETVKMSGTGQPHPDFAEALNRFVGTAIAICRLSEDDWTDADVIGLSIKHTDDDTHGINITLLKKFDEAEGAIAVVINSPYINPDLLSTDESAYLNSIFKEAELYLKGKRAQATLFAVA